MRWIVGSSLRFRYVVVGLAAALIFFGTEQVQKQKLDVFPEFAPTQVQIQTEALGLSAAEVEQLVTVPLENGLAGVPRVKTVRSESVPQLSSVILLFKSGTSLTRARQLVQERLQTVAPTLPSWASPPTMVPPVSTTSRVMAIGLTSKRHSQLDLSVSAFWNMRARLLRVPGVANVAIWGLRAKELQVLADPRRMQAAHVSLDDLMNVTSGALDAGVLQYTNGTQAAAGGYVDTPAQRASVEQALPVSTPKQLGQLPITSATGKTLRINQVAGTRWGGPPLIGDAVVNGGPGLLLIVEKFPGANTLDVTSGIDKAVKQLQPGLPGIHTDTHIFRPATFIDSSLHNLRVALIIGCILVILVLIAFLFQWRAAFISLVTIPLSVIAALVVLSLRGATINTMVLAGIAVAIGVVVDDAIIDTENIVRRLRLRWQEQKASGRAYHEAIMSVVLAASLEVRTAILYATFINVVAVVPVILAGGLSGSFFQPLALSYALAVLASMVVALTVTPALSLILLGGSHLGRESPLARWLKANYEATLARMIRSLRLTVMVVVLAVIAGVGVLPHLGQDLFPTFKERQFLMHWVTQPGTSIKEQKRIVTRTSRAVLAVPGVPHFGSHIGQATLGEEIAGPNFSESWISLAPKADYTRTTDSIRHIEAGVPGLYHDMQTYLREKIDETIAGQTEGFVVRIFGQDLNVLRRQAYRVQQAISNVHGLVDLHVEPQENSPQIEVTVRLGVARRYGLKPGDVRRAAATLLASEGVANIFRNQRTYEVVVWGNPAIRRNLSDIRRLPIDTPSGGQAALGRLADVRVAATPSVIKRENASRRIDVLANISGRDLGSVTSDVKQRLHHVKFPLGYHSELLGEAAERQAAQSRLVRYGILTVIAILFLLQVAFRSWRAAWLLFLTLPMALVGGLVAAWAFIGIISLGALIGFYTVLGIAARNGIMMVSHFQHLERNEGEPFGLPLVLRGARERLTPILMTASATALAILPLALSGDKPGQEIEHPMAVVILGGLVTSTLVNLFVVPSLYLRFGGLRGTDHDDRDVVVQGVELPEPFDEVPARIGS